MSELTACTIVSKNYLPFARVLAKSFLKQHPNSRFVTLLVDQVEGYFDPANEPFELVTAASLSNIPDLKSFLFKYTVLELNTAVKPYFLEMLLAREDCDKLLYLDPDIFVYRPLNEIGDLLESQSIVVIPHLTSPIDSPGLPDELTILRAGTYNLGFLGIADNQTTGKFLHWWQSRVFDQCVVRIEQGLFVDQKWIDLVPGLFEGVEILRHPGYDVAYWNLHERDVEVAPDGPRVNSEPLYFYHFSGLDPRKPEIISKHQNRFSWRELGPLRRLFKDYAQEVLDNGWEATKSWPYAYSTFDNGVKIPDTVRRMFLDMETESGRFGNPFETSSSRSYFRWLNAPAESGSSSCLTRLQHTLYLSRADLRGAFPDPFGDSGQSLAEWFSVHAETDFGLSDAWLDSLQPVLNNGVTETTVRKARGALTRAYRSQFANRFKDRAKRLFGEQRMKRLRRTLLGPPPPDPEPYVEIPVPVVTPAEVGVNVAGYIRTESGVGEGVRTMIRSLELAEIPHSLTNLEFNVLSRMDDDSFGEFGVTPNYPVNIFAVNADQVPAMIEQVGSEQLENRYNVGYWAWELDVFPSQWLRAFTFFDEIWTPSRFCVDVLSRVAPVPVRRIPHSVEVTASETASRQAFDLPQDRFLFLFAYDYLSFWERKNPLALVRAFRRAFDGRDDVGLVLKTINSDREPDRVAELKAEAAGLPVWHINSYLERQQVYDLMAACDAYVSLHRAEGFGLTLAEAMSLGKPVIATDYSGNCDFATLTNSLPVKYRLVTLEESCGPYVAGGRWAEPDEEHAAEQMLRLANEPELAQHLGKIAQRDISEYCGRKAIAKILTNQIQTIAQIRESRS
ncbi:MAG: glycosyltransferase [bacterium]|nr:glycosyltransferase [bacterium]